VTDLAKRSGEAKDKGPVRSTPGYQWTEAKREAFLVLLAQSCNVAASCRAVGMQTPSLYRLRRLDAGFAAEWRTALLAGYDRLEEQLLRIAGGATEGGAGDAPAFDPELAMRMLDRHRRAREKDQGGRGGPLTRATRAEAEAALHAKLDILARRRTRKAKA
jgi:hypothetical protein